MPRPAVNVAVKAARAAGNIILRYLHRVEGLNVEEKALHELDFDPAGFQWIDVTDADQSVVSLIRRGRSPADVVVAAFNFTPVPRHNYQIGVPAPGHWREMLNSDAPMYGGSGMGNLGGVDAVPVAMHGHGHSVTLTLPPLAALFLKPEPASPEQ